MQPFSDSDGITEAKAMVFFFYIKKLTNYKYLGRQKSKYLLASSNILVMFPLMSYFLLQKTQLFYWMNYYHEASRPSGILTVIVLEFI